MHKLFKVSWVLAIHPKPLWPKPKTKNQFCPFWESTLTGKKEKHTSANSVYAATASLKVSLRPYPRYARTSHTRERYRK